MGVELDTVTALDDHADDATLKGVAVRVVIDLDIDIVDSDGNARRYAALVHVVKAGFPLWVSDDLLVAPLGNFKLRELVADDGYIQKISATKAT